MGDETYNDWTNWETWAMYTNITSEYEQTKAIEKAVWRYYENEMEDLQEELNLAQTDDERHDLMEEMLELREAAVAAVAAAIRKSDEQGLLTLWDDPDRSKVDWIAVAVAFMPDPPDWMGPDDPGLLQLESE